MSTVYNKVTVNNETLIDLSGDTVASASHIRSGYVGHLNDGTQVIGSYSGGSPNLQAKSNISPTTSSQTIQADNGYDGLSSVQINAMPSGTAGTPSASKGTVSNHQVTVTPSVTNTTGYITGGTKTGTGVTVTASELASGNKSITSNGNNIDVVGYSTVSVNVSGSTGKNVQVYSGYESVKNNGYIASDVKLTVAKSGTYNVSWVAWRSSSQGTMGTNLYKNSTSGTNQQTFTGTYGQCITLTNQQYNADDVLTIYATSGSNSRTIYIGNLVIEEQ